MVAAWLKEPFVPQPDAKNKQNVETRITIKNPNWRPSWSLRLERNRERAPTGSRNAQSASLFESSDAVVWGPVVATVKVKLVALAEGSTMTEGHVTPVGRSVVWHAIVRGFVRSPVPPARERL